MARGFFICKMQGVKNGARPDLGRALYFLSLIHISPNTGYKVKSVTVVDKYNDSIKVYESSTANRYYFTMPDSNVTVNVEFTPRVMSNPFTDVRSTDWFYDAVNYVYSEGIMDGTSVYMFSPNNATSRGMLVTILWRLAGEPVVTGTSFSDVSSRSYYYYAVLLASKYGIVDGLGNNMFGPDPVSYTHLFHFSFV